MHKRFQHVFTSIKENTCVSYAKFATVAGFCDINSILIKATTPEDVPLRDRYVLQLLKIFSVSPTSYRTFATSFSRRFSNTKSWRVALKCLVLLHRLLRALPENSTLRTELIWNRSNGFLSLNPCHFSDNSSSYSRDYTHFIRSYANLLDEALDCLSLCDKTDEEERLVESFPEMMKEVGEILEILPQVQTLIDRVIECKPKGAASRTFLIHFAMKYIIRDSFFCYNTIRREIVTVLEHLIQMPYRTCVTAFGVYKKASIQADELSEFYDWCKPLGFCGLYEYPLVDRIPEIQIHALENFLSGMWQLTESSSSTGSPLTSTLESPSSSRDDESDKQIVRFEKWVEFDDIDVEINVENEDERKPLMEIDDDDDGISWEVLLEASVMLRPLVVSNNYFYFQPNGCRETGYNLSKKGSNGLEIQVYNPSVINPFHHPNYTFNGVFTTN